MEKPKGPLVKEMITSSFWMRKMGENDDVQQTQVEIVVMNMLEVEKLRRGGNGAGADDPGYGSSL